MSDPIANLSAARMVIRIDRGADFLFKVRLKQRQSNAPVDLTGCSIQLNLRRSIAGPPFMSLKSITGDIQVDLTTGEITAVVDATVVDAFPVVVIYDLLVSHPGGVDRKYLTGKVLVQ